MSIENFLNSQLIWAFLAPDYRAEGHALRAVIGLTPAAAELVLAEAYPSPAVRRAVAGAAKVIVRYFRDVGALDDPATLDAFTAAGLLDED